MIATTLGTWLAGEQLFQRRLQLIISRNSDWRVALRHRREVQAWSLQACSAGVVGEGTGRKVGAQSIASEGWGAFWQFNHATQTQKKGFHSPRVSGKQIPSNLPQALPPFRSKPLRSLFPLVPNMRGLTHVCVYVQTLSSKIR